MTSPDGVEWTLHDAAADGNWSSVTFGNDQFVAVRSAGGGGTVMTSEAVAPVPPGPVTDPTTAVHGMKITMRWSASTSASPVTAYAASCAKGAVRIRASLESTARKVTLVATSKGIWHCRVAAVSAGGRSTAAAVTASVRFPVGHPN